MSCLLNESWTEKLSLIVECLGILLSAAYKFSFANSNLEPLLYDRSQCNENLFHERHQLSFAYPTPWPAATNPTVQPQKRYQMNTLSDSL